MHFELRVESVRLIAYVAVGYALFICALLVADAAVRLTKVPLEAPQFLELQARRVENPGDNDLIEAIREMDEPELRRLFMLTRARLEHRGHEFPDLGPGVKIRRQMVRCGKESCTTCPHGPYLYAYWHEDGRQRSKYLGRMDDVPEAIED